MKRFPKAVSVLGVLGVLAVQSAVLAVEKPDMLLIMPDQMRGDCLSVLGHPVVHPPQNDRQLTL